MRTIKTWVATFVIAVIVSPLLHAETIRGKIVDEAGAPIHGVMVSAFDEEHRKWTSVYSQADGSFQIDGLRDTDHTLRTRLMGKIDEWIDDVSAGESNLAITVQPATGMDLEDHRPANSAFDMLKFDNMQDKENFKMMCSYCHQIGTIGFRTPEKPVDWETMLRRMDGFGGLYKHTQDTIIPRLIATYKDDAVNKWPPFVPPPPPTGTAAKAKITCWEIGKRFESSFHDLEPGPDGLMYAVNISQHYLVTLNTNTAEQTFYKFPVGSYGPHSIEPDNEGHMWITMCASGQMAKFDVDKKEFTICSSAEAPRRRGSYPHTLRVNPEDPEGLIWYTDAGENTCYSLHPKTLHVKKYPLLRANQAVAAGKGESRGITPYGLDFSPVDGMVWYSKLNGNRIGRIDPNAPDGDIKEWNPPFRGPRRLHVAADGMVWVPGFASGVFAKFDPNSEEWTVYDLPDAENQIPYALNIDPKGYVWICGTHNDTLNRFDPTAEELVEFRLPMRVSYTREIEFDSQGNVWTSTSGPSRHMERGFGAIIKLELPDDADNSGGIRLVGRKFAAKHEVGNRLADFYKRSPNGELFAEIDNTDLPTAYAPQRHQDYVDKRLAGLTEAQRGRIGRLWAERRRIDPNMREVGQTFVRIMEYVANEGKQKRPDQKAGAKMDRKPQQTDGVQGFVRFDGPRPKRRRLDMQAANGEISDCRQLHKEGLLDENMLVDNDGGLANAFVYVKKGYERKEYATPKDPAVLNQVGCMFRPRVQGLMIGQEFVMKNGDPLLHNVRANSFRNRPFNIAQPAGSPDRSKTFSRKEKAIMVQCDLHPWMRAFYFVMDHPYFAVTDEKGHFRITGLPPGAYTLQAWHEELGEQDVEVTVNANGLTEANFSFKPKKDNIIVPKAKTVNPTSMKHDHGNSPKQRAFVKKWSVEELSADANDLSARSAEHGGKVFSDAGCIKCHQLAGQGAKYGPELTDIAKRFKGPKLLQQVLKPSSEIHKEFQTQMFLTTSGRVISGLVVKNDTSSIHVLPNPLKPEAVEIIQKSDIQQQRPSDVSTMPEGLLDTFSRNEILDLLAFVQSGGKDVQSQTLIERNQTE